MRRRCSLIDVQFGLEVEEMVLSKQASERRWDAAEGLVATTSPAMGARGYESKGLRQQDTRMCLVICKLSLNVLSSF